jgi:hypothetical protein
MFTSQLRFLQRKTSIDFCFKIGLSFFLISLTTIPYSWGQSVTIVSPGSGECVSNPPPQGYDPINNPMSLIEVNGILAMENGILNGNALPPNPVPISVDISQLSEGEQWTLHVSAGGVSPAFPQPPEPSCLDLNDCNEFFCNTVPALCGDQGYCVFTGECLCLDNNDCSNGEGVCIEGKCAGCSTNEQCGQGQVCSDNGECGCADDSACGVGQACLEGGICSCADDDDCGQDGFVCA